VGLKRESGVNPELTRSGDGERNPLVRNRTGTVYSFEREAEDVGYKLSCRAPESEDLPEQELCPQRVKL